MHFHLSSSTGNKIVLKVGAEQLEPPISNSLVDQFAGRAASPSGIRGKVLDASAQEGELFDNRAELKTVTSQVSMHLSREQREDLFKQLDELLDKEAWADDSSLISLQSYRTFLKFLIYWTDVRRPALLVTSAGNLMASWVQPGRRLTIEYLPADKIRAVLYKVGQQPGSTETNAYVGPIKRLDAILLPFDAVAWYRNV
jgi:hypothetical protein